MVDGQVWPRWRAYINNFMKILMQKGIFYIHLCQSGRFLTIEVLSKVNIVVVLAIGANISLSIPYSCLKPWATKRALYWSVVSSNLTSMEYTHLNATIKLDSGHGTRSHSAVSPRTLLSHSLLPTRFFDSLWVRGKNGHWIQSGKQCWKTISIWGLDMRVECRNDS